jgi:hypothetical protein
MTELMKRIYDKKAIPAGYAGRPGRFMARQMPGGKFISYRRKGDAEPSVIPNLFLNLTDPDPPAVRQDDGS